MKCTYSEISEFPGPLFQNEGRCSAVDMEIIFHSHANEPYFHKKGCAPSLILKVRVFGTWKWPILFTAGLVWPFLAHSIKAHALISNCTWLMIANNCV